jgi:hypothetical protein
VLVELVSDQFRGPFGGYDGCGSGYRVWWCCACRFGGADRRGPRDRLGKVSGQSSAIDWRATLAEALAAPGSLGNTYTRFYNYSFLNQVRLMMQGTFEPVATYKRWQELGRQVPRDNARRGGLDRYGVQRQRRSEIPFPGQNVADQSAAN